MAVDDQSGSRDLCQPIDRREAVAVAGWGFVSHQNVEALPGEPGEVLWEN